MLRYRERTQRRHHRSLRLHQHAADNLKFIRDAMEHSSRFTDVPGRGMVVIGATAILAAAIASAQSTESSWLAVWAIEAGLAIAVGLVATELKARSSGSRLFDGPAKKFFLGLAPPLAAGAGLTAFLLAQDLASALPGLWLLIYGTAIVRGGAFSVRILPVQGLCFMGLGFLTLFLPRGVSDACLPWVLVACTFLWLPHSEALRWLTRVPTTQAGIGLRGG